MLFKFVADIEFEADDIDSAFDALSDHFRNLIETSDTSLDFVGEMNIKRVKGGTGGLSFGRYKERATIKESVQHIFSITLEPIKRFFRRSNHG